MSELNKPKKRGRKPKINKENNSSNMMNEELNKVNNMEVSKDNETSLNQTNDSLNDNLANNDNNNSSIPSSTAKEVSEVEEDVLDLNNDVVSKSASGLGDVVKKVTNALGIKTCDDCEKRRQKLNKLFPFTKNAKVELTEEEVEFVNSIEKTLTQEMRIKLGDIYDKTFGGKTRHCQCPGVYKMIIDRLKIQIQYQSIK